MISYRLKNSVVWAGATAIYLITQLVIDQLGFGDAALERLYGVIIAVLVTLPLLFKRSWYITVTVASIAWVLGPQFEWMTGGGIEWFSSRLAVQLLGMFFWIPVIAIHVMRQPIPSRLWALGILLGFMPVVVYGSAEFTGVGILLLFVLNVVPPLAGVLAAISYWKSRQAISP